MSFRKIGVIGAGAWGTALAQVCVRAGLDTLLQACEPALAEAMAGYLTDPIPTPGANGWTLEHFAGDHFVPYAQLADLYAEEAPAAPEALIDTPAVTFSPAARASGISAATPSR